MAVYTQVGPRRSGRTSWPVTTSARCPSAKGIAEGVENSNFLVDTTGGRFILTLYEKRVEVGDLPFFVDLLDHLADAKLPGAARSSATAAARRSNRSPGARRASSSS